MKEHVKSLAVGAAVLGGIVAATTNIIAGTIALGALLVCAAYCIGWFIRAIYWDLTSDDNDGEWGV